MSLSHFLNLVFLIHKNIIIIRKRKVKILWRWGLYIPMQWRVYLASYVLESTTLIHGDGRNRGEEEGFVTNSDGSTGSSAAVYKDAPAVYPTSDERSLQLL